MTKSVKVPVKRTSKNHQPPSSLPDVVPVSMFVPNKDNPRKIKKKDLRDLVQSIKDFPKMMRLRPIVYDPKKKNMVLAGNQRLEALKEIGYKEIPREWTKDVGDLSEDEKREFILKDNIHAGEFNLPLLSNGWSKEEIGKWTNIKLSFANEENGEMKFSNELDAASNYIVWKFNRDIDWIFILSIFNIESTYSRRQNGKPWSKGQGRVIDGMQALEMLKRYFKEHE